MRPGRVARRAGLRKHRFSPSAGGFSSLPTFAWAERLARSAHGSGTGAFARVSSGFEVTFVQALRDRGRADARLRGRPDVARGRPSLRHRRQPSTQWRRSAGTAVPAFGRTILHARPRRSALQFKLGTLLVRDDVLLYSKLGFGAVHGDVPTSDRHLLSSALTREDIAIRPDARVGAEWAITDRLSVAVEVGVVRSAGALSAKVERLGYAPPAPRGRRTRQPSR